MVRFAQIVGAVALLSHSVLAAPAVRRDSHESYNQPAEYGQDKPSYDKGNEYQPSYDDKYKDDKYKDDKYKDDKYKDDKEKPYEPPAKHEYGSGQNQWGKSYDDCVSKCVAQYGAPPKEWKPSEPIAPPKGNGAVHTVMVAPMQGVLRYWPFAVNATVGDTIRYVWSTPANHTATLSSALALCNRSERADDLEWVSGVRNASAGTQTFDVTIKTDEQQFFYCSVAQHCEKGMFGMVQPKKGGNNTVGAHMNKWLDSNPDLKAAWSSVHEKTKGTAADTWGDSFSVDDVPEAAYMDMAKNIIYSRAMFAENPGSLEASSAETSDKSPVKVIGDVNTFLASTSQDPPSSVPQGTPTGSVPAPSAAASQLANSNTSAGMKTAAPVWVAALVGAVSYLML